MMTTTILNQAAPFTVPTPGAARRPTPTEFLRALFATIPPDQYLERRAIHAKSRAVDQAFYTPDAIDDLYGDGCRLVEAWDVYFGAAPRVRPSGTKADVTHAPALWADLDFKRFPDGEAGALRQLEAFPLKPTWIIATGRGFHLYWKLREVARADAAFEGRLKGLARQLQADPAATDRSRVLRIPGTFNHKYADCQVRIIAWPTSS